MIFGIGCDIVNISRIEEALVHHGESFAQRILTSDEFSQFQRSNQQFSFLAKRFAAKEAAAKALGTGFREGVSLKNIAVDHAEHGRPHLLFSGKAAELISTHNITRSHLSISDEKEYAIAYVILEVSS